MSWFHQKWGWTGAVSTVHRGRLWTGSRAVLWMPFMRSCSWLACIHYKHWCGTRAGPMKKLELAVYKNVEDLCADLQVWWPASIREMAPTLCMRMRV